jgi:hypothetical protein
MINTKILFLILLIIVILYIIYSYSVNYFNKYESFISYNTLIVPIKSIIRDSNCIKNKDKHVQFQI